MSEANMTAGRRVSAEPPSAAALALAARARRPATSAVAVAVPITVSAPPPPDDPLPAAAVSSTADLITAIEGPRGAPAVPAREPETARSGAPAPPSAPAVTVPPAPATPAIAGPPPARRPSGDAEQAAQVDRRPPHSRLEPVQADAPRARPEPPLGAAVPAPAPLPVGTVHTAPDEAQVTARAVRPPAAEPPDRTAPIDLSALLERVSRATAGPQEARPQRPEPVLPDPAPEATAAREAGQAPPVMTAPPQAAPPPVTIGEIHIHEAAQAGPAADPLALLAPYTGGLTVRRGSLNTPAGAR